MSGRGAMHETVDYTNEVQAAEAYLEQYSWGLERERYKKTIFILIRLLVAP